MGEEDDAVAAILAIAAGIAIAAGVVALLEMLNEQEKKRRRRY